MVKEEIETQEFLDSLPWDTLIESKCDLYDLMDKIEKIYGPTLIDNPTFEGEVFNWMSTEDFVNYLHFKEGIHVHAEVSVKYTVNR